MMGLPEFQWVINGSVLLRNFITGNNVPRLLKKWGYLRKNRDIVGKMTGQ